ncbi:twitchin-like protein, partial [Dinothrombium tinctorium]
VTLSWKKPSNDGGSKIIGYVVEKKPKDGKKFEPCNARPCPEPTYTVTGLKEGEEYEFRVVAVNEIGESPPSKACPLVKVEEQPDKPRIDANAVKDITVKAGEEFQIVVPFTGFPKPEATWTLNDKPISPNDKHFASKVDEDKAVLTCPSAARGDTGPYTVMLKNPSGFDTIKCNVTVLDRPSPPTDLTTEDADGSSLSLKWSPPKDDGGAEITNYVVEKREPGEKEWTKVSSFVTKPEFKVRNLVPGKKYEFRVMAENQHGKSDPAQTDHLMFDTAGAPGAPKIVDYDKNFVKLQWDPPLRNGGAPITGYIIEKKDKHGNWVKAVEVPDNSCQGKVSGLVEGEKYEFRVRAVNKAGPGAASESSGVHTAKPKSLKPSIDRTNLKPTTVKVGQPVHFDVKVIGEPPPKVIWYFNGKEIGTGPVYQIDNVDYNTKFSIPKTSRKESGTYKIVATNSAGSDEAEVTVLVQGKPSPPNGPLEVSNVHNEGCTLKWKPPDDDGGCPIECYEIEKLDEDTGKWVPCGRSTEPHFDVKNLIPGHKYKFRVRAVNKEGDSDELVTDHGIIAKNPFDTPDAPGQPKATDWSPTSATIEWTPPINDGGRPIEGYIIEKKDVASPTWQRVNTSPINKTKFTVPALTPGRTYEFRVIAVNEGGPGKPSKPSTPVTAEERKFAPDAPDMPRPEKITKDSVTLTWKKPANDGGSKIVGYLVEKKQKGAKDFEICNTVPCPEPIFTVTKLTEGEEYEFRVVAVNDIGESPPSKPCPLVKVEEQPDKPRIDAGAVKDIVVRAGQEFSINVPFTGFPKPTATWSINDKDIDEGNKRFFNKVADDYALLACSAAERGDTGKYSILLKNPSGFDTVSCNVKVLDRPSPPQNLRGEDIEGDSLTLKWSPPKDDGGAEITNYVVEKREVGTVAWVKVSSFVPDTSLRVKNLVVGKKYEFRVMAENQYGTSDPCETEEPILAKLPYDVPSAPGVPRSVDSTPDSITISWTKPRSDGGSPITGYIVEKRKIGEKGWTRATPHPVSDLTFKVPGLQENNEYEFRVAAINAAGQGPFSEASDGIFARYPPSSPKIDPNYRLKDLVVMAGEKFSLRVPFSGTPLPKVEWSVNGEIIIPDDRVTSEVNVAFTILTNKASKRGDTGHYTLKLTNSEGFDTCSCRVLVVDKPGPPQGPLEINDITPETCSLFWKPPLDDGGSPITNYVIEKLDPTTGQWVKLTGFCKRCHYDVIGLEPNKKYSFRVMAENQYGLSIPLNSDGPIIAKFPFDVPDPPERLKVVDVDSNSVSLTWEKPYRDGGSKIQGYQVEYRDPTDGKWRIANPFLIKDTSFTVTGLIEHRDYEFRVKAKNAAGYSKPSESTGLVNTRPKFSVPSPPRNLHITKVGKSYVDLKWEKPISDGGSKIRAYIVERKDASSTFWIKVNDYGCLDCEYTVLNLIENNEYDFRVFAVNDAGKSEPCQIAQPVKVTDIVGGTKPEFVRKLFNKNTNLKGQIKFECEAIGKPTPTARWFKNGRELPPSGRYKTTDNGEGVFCLIFDEVLEVDEADYTCEAANVLGSTRCSASLRIASPPQIIRCPDAVYFPEHDNEKVKIYFTGSTPMDVVLYKDGVEVKDTERLKCTIFDEYCIIFVRDVLKSDQGKYKLVVKNDSGEASATFTLYVTGLPGPPQGPLEISEITQHSATLSWKPPAFDGGCKVTHYIVERKETTHTQWITATSCVRDTNFTVQGLTENGEYLFRVMAVNENGQSIPLEGLNPIVAKLPFDPPSAPGIPTVTEVGGDFVNLQWDKPESDGGSRILGYFIEKREVGVPTWQRVNNVLCHSTQINIANLIEDRQYEFRVFAVNEAGLSPPSSNSSSVKIKDPQTAVPPEFIVPLKNVMAVENKSCQFTCTVTGNPKPHISWYKGARELYDGGKYTMLQEGDTYTLSIIDVFGEDADEYSVRAVNKGGARTSRAELFIKTPPRIYVPPRFRESACFERGENVVLKIPFTGYPKPKIKWSKDGEEIESGGHFDVQIKERHAILIIRDASKIDCGPYRIVAENELGVDSAIINVQISDRPDPPRFPAVETVGDDFVTISWKPPQWDGGSAITNYVIEKREPTMTSWVRCGVTRFTLHQVTGLNPQKDYEFRIFAENIYGRSDPSEVTPIITTRPSEKDKAKKKHWLVDEKGNKVRGRDEGKITDYDQFVREFDRQQYAPVDIKTSSVHHYYDILEEIGTGAFGVVHRCREKKTGHIFAAKFIPVSHPYEKSLIRKEIDIMNHLHHPKLIRLHDAFEDEDEMVLIYEFMSGGELFERITDEGYHMSEAEAANYMRQVCEAVKHMHEKNIIHLDIKPENIMCQTKNSTNVKLIDFGLATKLDPNEVVKISTGTAEFAAPEIVEREAVGFYTDMWAVGVLAYVLLSGLSPFAGDNDIETLKNVKACDWSFDDEAFKNISEEAKDFIRKLLTRKTDKRMTAHQCLEHPWLKQKEPPTTPISNRKYIPIRDKIRAKYGDYWWSVKVPIGHISNYSSLRKLKEELYKIHDTYIDRRELAPRFVIRPQSTFAFEGQAAKFYCRVLAAAPPTVVWYRDNSELKQSVKYMKRYQDEDYTFVINRCKLDDRGEYIIRAENHYGWREEPVFLNVQAKPVEVEAPKLEEPVRRRREAPPPVWLDEKDSGPHFTFLLRPRVIQHGIGVKLLACVSGKPTPEIKWFKDGKELSRFEYNMTHADGVVTLDISSCTIEDAGKYKCVASNYLGEAETTCQVIVEGSCFSSLCYIDLITNTNSFYRKTASSASITLYANRRNPTTATEVKKPPKKYGKSDSGAITPHRTRTKELTLPEQDSAPEFEEKLSNLTIKDGEPLLLKCVVKGVPEPKVEWTKNGEILRSSDIMDLKYKNRVATLSIGEVYPEDEGEYVCKATNSEGSTTTKCRLTVIPMEQPEAESKTAGAKGAPRLISHLTSSVVNDGDPVTLRCTIKGKQTPTKFDIVWLHNDKEIKPSNDFKYKNEGDDYLLVIAEVYPEDAGIYTCEAFNDFGEAFSSCSLIVKVPNEELPGPNITVFPTSQTVVEGRLVSFTVETLNEIKIVEWSKDGKAVTERSTHHRLTQDSPNKVVMSIPSVDVSDIGQYTVKLTNKSGDSTAAFALNVLTEAMV